MPLYVAKSANMSFTLTEGQLMAMFKEGDTNGDGGLSKEEVQKVFEKLGSRNPWWRVHRSLQHADRDGNGIISKEEIDELVKYAVKLGYDSHTIKRND